MRRNQKPKRLRSADITGEMTWFQMPPEHRSTGRTTKTIYLEDGEVALVLSRIDRAAVLDALRYRLSAPGAHTSETAAVGAVLEKLMRR